MISGHGNIETAVSAIKAGAYDFIEKPFKADRLVLVAERALEASRLKREVRDLRARSGPGDAASPASRSRSTSCARRSSASRRPTRASWSPARRAPARNSRRARSTRCRRARAAPSSSCPPRRSRPRTWRRSCSASRAATGKGRRVGALEEAHGGTLYIDEIADMPRETQSRILRVLVDQNFQRVGGTTRVHVDVRIISSSSRDLAAEIAAGRFREDLFHRLGVVPIRIPSLSERREDVPELIDFFMDQISRATGLPKRRIAEDAMAVLQSHDWPGNVRQLRNNVERLMILTTGEPDAPITADMLPSEVGALVPSTPGGAGGEKLMSLPSAGGARDLRARIPSRPDRPLQRKHLADGGIHRHGALGPPPQAEVARDRRLIATIHEKIRRKHSHVAG